MAGLQAGGPGNWRQAFQRQPGEVRVVTMPLIPPARCLHKYSSGGRVGAIVSMLSVTTARAVLVDMRPPMDSYTCLNIQEALSSTMNLMIHLDGASRLPYFGLIVLGNYPEVSTVV